MFSEAALLAWSLLGLSWWGVAWWLVASVPPTKKAREPFGDYRSLTIFKPLPPLGPGSFREASALETFLAQLGETDELLLGIHEADRALVEPVLAAMQARYSSARLKMVWRTAPDSVANPKVAWLKILAPHASGELWLWSDADIHLPPDFLAGARQEFAAAGVKLLTWPYRVCEIPRPPAVLDALFVNTEFLPGVLLLRGRGEVDFGLGAALLFARVDFEEKVGWEEVGESLADDFVLGQKLQPVRIGSAILTTAADETSWRGAVGHYLRWSKTIRWNRPLGTAGRVLVLPSLGWIAFILAHPMAWSGWAGLLAMMQVDSLFALLICRRVGCGLGVRDFLPIELWSIGRVLIWVAAWLPGPVPWRGRLWWGPHASRTALARGADVPRI